MKNIVIVDIDGTISKVGDRIKYLQEDNPDWDSFYEGCFDDEAIDEICNLVYNIGDKYIIVYCTGRRESVRDKTMKWLKFYTMPSGLVLMRSNDDIRHDTEVKPELIKNAGIKLENIAFVLEDRNSMVKKWREMGLKCLQVAEGDF